MRAFCALISALAPIVVVAAFSSEANAYERQWQAGVGLGYSLLMNGGATSVASTSLHGAGASLSLTYGLSDAINLIGHVDFSAHSGDVPVLVGGGAVGAAYVLDVLRWVPWIGVTVGGYGVSALSPCAPTVDLSCTTARFGINVPFGLDYQVNRSFSIGATGRYGLLILGSPLAVDQTITGLVRAQYIWGY